MLRWNFELERSKTNGLYRATAVKLAFSFFIQCWLTLGIDNPHLFIKESIRNIDNWRILKSNPIEIHSVHCTQMLKKLMCVEFFIQDVNTCLKAKEFVNGNFLEGNLKQGSWRRQIRLYTYTCKRRLRNEGQAIPMTKCINYQKVTI